MPLNHFVTSKDVYPRGLSERDMLRLPLTSVTRDATRGNRITQIVKSGTHPEGHAFTMTYNYTYSASTGLVDTEQRIYAGEGNTLTETETFTRDASGNVTGSGIALS